MFAQLASLALAGFAAAQTTSTNGSASAYDVNLVTANFQSAQIVPQLVTDFAPQGTLGVSFGGQAITIGQKLEQSAVGTLPELTVAAASTGSRINTNSMYTVAMIDANTVGTDQNTTAQTRHWLVNTVMLSGSPPYSINYTGATSVTDYAGPGPASGSGSHRYVLFLYAQSSAFAPPGNLSSAGTPLGTMFFDEYVKSTGLGPLVAANYFQVENGVATVTPLSTSAVNTATIASSATSSAASSGAASSASGSASGSRTSAGTATNASASASTSTSRAAAGKVKPLNVGVAMIAGGLGVVGVLVGASLGF